MDTDPKLYFKPSHHLMVESMAANEGMTLLEYLHEAVGLGIFCADTVLKNRTLGVDTTLFFEQPCGAYAEYPMDFDPVNPDDMQDSSDFPEIDNPFADLEDFNLSFDAHMQQEIGDRVFALGTTLEAFMEVSINLRWNYGTLTAGNREMYINDGSDTVVSIGFDPAPAQTAS